MRLGNISGTKQTVNTPLLILGSNYGMVINDKARSILGLAEGSRVDFYEEAETEDLFICKLPDGDKSGKAISKTGKFIHMGTHSYLSDNDQGEAAQWEITNELKEFSDTGDLVWHKMVIFEAPKPESKTQTIVEAIAIEGVTEEEEEEEVAMPTQASIEDGIAGVNEEGPSDEETSDAPAPSARQADIPEVEEEDEF